MDSYVAEVATNPTHTTIIFTLKEQPGALATTLKVFKASPTVVNYCYSNPGRLQEKEVNLTHIESRPSMEKPGCYEILVECAEDSDKDKVEQVIQLFKRKAGSVRVQDFNSQVKQNKGA